MKLIRGQKLQLGLTSNLIQDSFAFFPIVGPPRDIFVKHIKVISHLQAKQDALMTAREPVGNIA